MASRTENYGLIKPAYDDTIDVEQLNSNADITDNQLKKLSDEKVNKSGDTMTGTLTVPNLNVQGNIYNTDDELSIYGGNSTYETTPTLDLTSGTRSVGVYAQLSVPFKTKNRKNYLQLNGDSGNLNLQLDGGIWIDRNYGTHQTYIGRTGNSAQLVLNDSEYSSQPGYFSGITDDGTNRRGFYFAPNGTFSWDGEIFKSSRDLSRFQSRDAESYVEAHTNGYVYVKGTIQTVGGAGSTCTIMSPNGTWFSIADDGKARTAEGDVVCQTLQQTPNDSYVQGDVWKFSDGMMIQAYTVWNGASWVSKRYVTLWQPFLSSYYTVVGGMRTHSGQGDIRINADYRCATFDQTATGFWIGCDSVVDTTFIAIGRWK